jgi:four helix bundle protein
MPPQTRRQISPVRYYRDLEVWQTAIEFAVSSYDLSRTFPRSELFGLTSQLQRAAVSIATNIAEGHGRGTPREFLRFLSYGRGSLRECETLLIIANRIGYSKGETNLAMLSAADRIGRMLHGLTTSVAKNA